MDNQLATVEQSSMLTMLENMACNPAVDADKLAKILDQQERIFDKNAKIAFNGAMVACQKEMPCIVKDAVNKQTNSTYAKYETVIRQMKPVYTEHGFCLSFGSDNSPLENHIRVTCEVMHSGGYSKTYNSDLPIDNAGLKGTVNKTGVHATASTYSYGKRYLAMMIFNVPAADEDDDAVKAGGVTVGDLLEHNGLIRELIQSVATIKMGIAMQEYSRAHEAWQELTEDEKRVLWRAPTKGGLFTTQEREIMKSTEFRQ